MGEDEGRGRAGPAIGIVGALAAIVSIWWFALRPRLRRDEPTVSEGLDESDG